jgi:hypothetical protein
MLPIQNLQPGTRIKLKGEGKIVEVVENPQDGTWLIVRGLDTGAPDELCHADEILELA